MSFSQLMPIWITFASSWWVSQLQCDTTLVTPTMWRCSRNPTKWLSVQFNSWDQKHLCFYLSATTSQRFQNTGSHFKSPTSCSPLWVWSSFTTCQKPPASLLLHTNMKKLEHVTTSWQNGMVKVKTLPITLCSPKRPKDTCITKTKRLDNLRLKTWWGTES